MHQNIRGKCSVQLLNELEELKEYLSEEDTFFYTMVYDPNQKTLMVDKGEIRIGSDYQADILPMVTTSMCVCVCMCIHVCMYVCICTCVCMYVTMCAYMIVCLYVCTAPEKDRDSSELEVKVWEPNQMSDYKVEQFLVVARYSKFP